MNKQNDRVYLPNMAAENLHLRLTTSVNFQLPCFSSKSDHFVCSQTAQFEMDSHRRKNSVSCALSCKRSNSLAFSSRTFNCPLVSSCTWNFNGFNSSSFFTMCCIRSHDMFSSRAIFLPLRCLFRTNVAFTFRIVVL